MLSRNSTESATKAASLDAQYADLRRASLPAQYANPMAKQMFFAKSSRKMRTYSADDEEEEGGEKLIDRRRGRSSSISYERHDGVVMEEICRIVESEEGREAQQPIVSLMKDDIIRAKELEGVLETEESPSPTKKEITGITDSLQHTHLARKSNAPKRTLLSARSHHSFRRIGRRPASKNFLDNWGDYNYHTHSSTCSGQQHLRRLMHNRNAPLASKIG